MTRAFEDYADLVCDLASTMSATGAGPDDVAIVDRLGPQTRAELADRVGSLADGLRGLGVMPGDVVALWLPNRREWLETALAAGIVGAVVLGINTKLRSHDAAELVRRSRARVLVVDPTFKGIDFAEMVSRISTSAPDLHHVLTPSDQAALMDIEAPSADGHLDPTRPVQAFTSSGSTGEPKLVLHSPRGLLFHAAANARAFGLDDGSAAALVSLPLCGVFGYNAALAGLAAGRPVVLQEVFDATEAVDLIERHGVTHLSASDTMLERLCDATEARGPGTASTWKHTAFGNFTPGDCSRLVGRGDAQGRFFFQTYGSSEVLSTLTAPGADADWSRRAQGGGVAIDPHIRLDVRDPAGVPLPIGEQGELWVAGPTVCLGYLREGKVHAPTLTEDGFFATGDLAVRRTDRDVVYLGRLDDSVRIAGFLFSPAEVEVYLDGLEGVGRSAYVAVEHEGSVHGVAFITPSPGTQLDTAVLDARARRELASFKVPSVWSVLPELPLIAGANGDKVDRRTLGDLARQALSADRPGVHR